MAKFIISAGYDFRDSLDLMDVTNFFIEKKGYQVQEIDKSGMFRPIELTMLIQGRTTDQLNQNQARLRQKVEEAELAYGPKGIGKPVLLWVKLGTAQDWTYWQIIGHTAMSFIDIGASEERQQEAKVTLKVLPRATSDPVDLGTSPALDSATPYFMPRRIKGDCAALLHLEIKNTGTVPIENLWVARRGHHLMTQPDFRPFYNVTGSAALTTAFQTIGSFTSPQGKFDSGLFDVILRLTDTSRPLPPVTDLGAVLEPSGGLQGGFWGYAITALDSFGNESAPSNQANITVPTGSLLFEDALPDPASGKWAGPVFLGGTVTAPGNFGVDRPGQCIGTSQGLLVSVQSDGWVLSDLISSPLLSPELLPPLNTGATNKLPPKQGELGYAYTGEVEAFPAPLTGQLTFQYDMTLLSLGVGGLGSPIFFPQSAPFGLMYSPFGWAFYCSSAESSQDIGALIDDWKSDKLLYTLLNVQSFTTVRITSDWRNGPLVGRLYLDGKLMATLEGQKSGAPANNVFLGIVASTSLPEAVGRRIPNPDEATWSFTKVQIKEDSSSTSSTSSDSTSIQSSHSNSDSNSTSNETSSSSSGSSSNSSSGSDSGEGTGTGKGTSTSKTNGTTDSSNAGHSHTDSTGVTMSAGESSQSSGHGDDDTTGDSESTNKSTSTGTNTSHSQSNGGGGSGSSSGSHSSSTSDSSSQSNSSSTSTSNSTSTSTSESHSFPSTVQFDIPLASRTRIVIPQGEVINTSTSKSSSHNSSTSTSDSTSSNSSNSHSNSQSDSTSSSSSDSRDGGSSDSSSNNTSQENSTSDNSSGSAGTSSSISEAPDSVTVSSNDTSSTDSSKSTTNSTSTSASDSGSTNTSTSSSGSSSQSKSNSNSDSTSTGDSTSTSTSTSTSDEKSSSLSESHQDVYLIKPTLELIIPDQPGSLSFASAYFKNVKISDGPLGTGEAVSLSWTPDANAQNQRVYRILNTSAGAPQNSWEYKTLGSSDAAFLDNDPDGWTPGTPPQAFSGPQAAQIRLRYGSSATDKLKETRPVQCDISNGRPGFKKAASLVLPNSVRPEPESDDPGPFYVEVQARTDATTLTQSPHITVNGAWLMAQTEPQFHAERIGLNDIYLYQLDHRRDERNDARVYSLDGQTFVSTMDAQGSLTLSPGGNWIVVLAEAPGGVADPNIRFTVRPIYTPRTEFAYGLG